MKDFFLTRFTTIHEFMATQHWPSIGDWRQIFSWSFWNESYISATSPYYLLASVFLIVFVLGLLVWRWQLKKAHRVTPIFIGPLNQLLNLIIFIIIISISYLFFRTQQINYLSSRLVVLLSLVITVVWLGWILYYVVGQTPRQRSQYLEKERFFRYLPKKKEKRI